MYEQSDWYGLYGKSWTGIIVPESFCHPAKFSRALIRRIYQHAFKEGWLKAGDVVCDPFGGIALGALEAMRRGLAWVGVELEQKFVDLGQQNIDLWNERYGPHLPGWGSAVLLQGDSRNLAQVMTEAGRCVSSPPYAQAQSGGGIAVTGTYPHPSGTPKSGGLSKTGGYRTDLQGSAPGQLAALPEGDLAAAISSPPFQGVLHQTAGGMLAPHQQAAHGRDENAASVLAREYGSHPAQLGQMRDGGFDAAVSSPPFENVEGSHSARKFADPEKSARARAQAYKTGAIKGHYASEEAILRSLTKANEQTYGDTDGNIGQESGDTFWAASRLIVEQVYQVLKPGGVAIFVTKSFIRKGKRVDFPGQWRDLCEACGFVTLHQHRAWLVEDRGAQYDLMGELHHREVKHISFFRRLHAKKYPHLAIDWETVLCFRKPL